MNAVSEKCGSEAAHPAACEEAGKWGALVDDQPVPMPQRVVKASVLLSQAGVGDGRVLVRDHNSPSDVVFTIADVIDLGEGNVFYTLSACDVQPRESCHAAAKLAFFVDDRPELTTRPTQSGRSLRELFSLPANTRLVRDHEGPNDDAIGLDDAVDFRDGCVFFTRSVAAELRITVNARVFTEHDGVKPIMTGREIAALVYPDAPGATKVWLVTENREVGLDEHLKIRGCEVFDVVRKNVDGGFELSRVEVELQQLQIGGLTVTLVPSPTSAVIYHDLRVKPGHSVTSTDVLVPVPGGYPGQMLDWAYLPEGSPLIGHVKGQPQDHRITALGRTWRQISYHPHKGGGGPAWNPARHGFHTYLGELLTWLYDAN